MTCAVRHSPREGARVGGLALPRRPGRRRESPPSLSVTLLVMIRSRLSRRFTALAIQLLLLHPVLGTDAGPCTMQGGLGAAGMTMTGSSNKAHHAMPAAGASSREPAASVPHDDSSRHCSTTCAPSACQSNGQCSPPVAAASRARGCAELRARDELSARVVALPHSVSTAPEPPPPRELPRPQSEHALPCESRPGAPSRHEGRIHANHPASRPRTPLRLRSTTTSSRRCRNSPRSRSNGASPARPSSSRSCRYRARRLDA